LQRVSLLNISAGDIVDGNPKMTLALVWNIILGFQFNKGMKALPLPDMVYGIFPSTFVMQFKFNEFLFQRNEPF